MHAMATTAHVKKEKQEENGQPKEQTNKKTRNKQIHKPQSLQQEKAGHFSQVRCHPITRSNTSAPKRSSHLL
jgi:hypothetical protein